MHGLIYFSIIFHYSIQCSYIHTYIHTPTIKRTGIANPCCYTTITVNNNTLNSWLRLFVPEVTRNAVDYGLQQIENGNLHPQWYDDHSEARRPHFSPQLQQKSVCNLWVLMCKLWGFRCCKAVSWCHLRRWRAEDSLEGAYLYCTEMGVT